MDRAEVAAVFGDEGMAVVSKPRVSHAELGGWAPRQQDTPDVLIDAPLHALVAQVKASQLVKGSDHFNSDYYLRFPRLDRWRDDRGTEFRCCLARALLTF